MDMDGYASDIGMDHPGLLTFSLWHHDPPPGCFPDDAVNDLAKLLPRIRRPLAFVEGEAKRDAKTTRRFAGG